ncbi:TPA: hypothetical protein ROW14_004504, partial [Yersinia enterocolitica]|nr:hypothetical protein [Yersinia enterocolitica]
LAQGLIQLNLDNYLFCLEYSRVSLISSIFSIKDRGDLKKEFVDLENFNAKFFDKNFTMIVSVDMNYLRSLGMAIYKDLNEAINLNPKAKEKFILLRSPEGKIELYPDEIVKGKVLHYIQISRVWDVLVNSSDDSDGNSCTFLGARKSFVTLQYDFNDLDYDLDG